MGTMTNLPAERLERLRRFVWWMDEGIRIPGTRLRIGLDPILGLVPGVGDVAGALLAGAVVVESLRRGISRFTLLRMAANIALDAALGTVPVIGDLFDAGWKGNRRNMALLERHLAEPRTSTHADRAVVLAVGAALLLLCATIVVGAVLAAVKTAEWLLTGA
jgi:hypothetical protein